MMAIEATGDPKMCVSVCVCVCYRLCSVQAVLLRTSGCEGKELMLVESINDLMHPQSLPSPDEVALDSCEHDDGDDD